jgi:hypothetical protein
MQWQAPRTSHTGVLTKTTRRTAAPQAAPAGSAGAASGGASSHALAVLNGLESEREVLVTSTRCESMSSAVYRNKAMHGSTQDRHTCGRVTPVAPLFAAVAPAPGSHSRRPR